MPIADPTRDPDTMTAKERRDEAVGILAHGLRRSVAVARARASRHGATSSDSRKTGLELSADAGLSVAPRPAG